MLEVDINEAIHENRALGAKFLKFGMVFDMLSRFPNRKQAEVNPWRPLYTWLKLLIYRKECIMLRHDASTDEVSCTS